MARLRATRKRSECNEWTVLTEVLLIRCVGFQMRLETGALPRFGDEIVMNLE
jgi:hypothetical protein